MTAPDDRPAGEAELEPASREELEADIVRTREQLGRTVEALSHRLDVKARMRDKARRVRIGGRELVARARQRASHDEDAPNNVEPAAAALLAVVLGAITMAVIRSRRS